MNDTDNDLKGDGMKIEYYGDFKEWDKLIDQLKNDEEKLVAVKEQYLKEEQRIVEETDFKALYGANNQKVRDNHVKEELSDLNDEIVTLKLNISNNLRRIEFLKSLTRLKTEIIRYDEEIQL